MTLQGGSEAIEDFKESFFAGTSEVSSSGLQMHNIEIKFLL